MNEEQNTENAIAISGENAVVNFDDLANVPAEVDAETKALMSSGRLPAIKLMSGQSEAVKGGRCGINIYALEDANKVCTDLGKQPIVVPIAFRPLAIDRSDKATCKFYYNAKSPEFQDVKAKSEASTGMSDWMCGIQFLIWLPEVHQFATYYLHNYSTKALGPVFHANIGKPVQMGMEQRTSKKAQTTYMAPIYGPSSVAFDKPENDELNSVMNTFKNAKDSAEAVGEEAANTNTDR